MNASSLMPVMYFASWRRGMVLSKATGLARLALVSSVRGLSGERTGALELVAGIIET